METMILTFFEIFYAFNTCLLNFETLYTQSLLRLFEKENIEQNFPSHILMNYAL